MLLRMVKQEGVQEKRREKLSSESNYDNDRLSMHKVSSQYACDDAIINGDDLEP